MIRVTTFALLLLLCPFARAGEGEARDALAAPATARAFLDAWAAGDVARAATFWASPATPDFDRHVRRALTMFCVDVHGRDITDVREIAADRVEVTASLFVTKRSVMPGAKETTANIRARLTLQRDGEAWRIVQWREWEERLVDELLALPTPPERSRWLDARSAEWTPALARLLGERAVMTTSRADPPLARELVAYATRVAAFLGDAASRSYALAAASAVARASQPPDLQSAATAAAEAFALAQESSEPDVLANAILRVGRASAQRDPAVYQRVLALSDYVEDQAVIAMAATQLALHHQSLGENRLSLAHSALAARAGAASGNKAAMLSAEFSFAGLYRAMGDAELAALHYERGLALALQIGYTRIYASFVHDFVTAQLAAGQPPATLLRTVDAALAMPAVAQDRSVATDLLCVRSRLHTATGELVQAEADLVEALAIAGDADSRKPYAALAELRLKQGRFREAATAMELGPRILGIPEWALYAEALRGAGDVDEAITLTKCGIEYTEYAFDRTAMDDRLRQAFLANRYALEQILVELLVQRRQEVPALAVAETAKARVLRDVAGRTRKPPDSASAEVASERQVMQKVESLNRAMLAEKDDGRLASLRTDVAQARLELDDLRARIAAGQRGYQLYGNASWTSKIEWPFPGVTALQYVVGDQQTTVFVIRAGTAGELLLDVHTVPIAREELTALVAQLRDRIAARDLRYGEPGRRLYDLLLAPAADRIGAAKMLCIIPDGELWKVPFQVLAPRNGAPLMERTAVFYAPSVQMLTAVHRTRKPERQATLLAFGNPLVGKDTEARFRAFERASMLGDLSEAETEVREIGRLYGADRSSVYVRGQAREALFKEKAPQFDVLHVAAHGLLDDSAPRFSSLVLAGDEVEDGLLEAHEVADLHLGAGLVVLSACETATGKVGAGEGILGLSWAFLAAGAQTLVGSQWKAPSAATELLMVRFHERLLAGDSPAEALRQAQRRVRRDERYTSPLDWGAFIVVGDGL